MKLILFLSLLAIIAPLVVSAQPCSSDPINLNLDYPKFGPFDLNINQSLVEAVGYLYYFIVGISGLAAFAMLVWGGIQWLTSGAIPSQAGEAKDKIKNAILGLLLVLASFLIIQIINPELTILNQSALDCLKGENPVVDVGLAVDLTGIPLDGGDGPPDGPLTVPAGASIKFSWTTSGADTCAGTDPNGDPIAQPPTDPPITFSTAPLVPGAYSFTIECWASADPATKVPDHVDVNIP